MPSDAESPADRAYQNAAFIPGGADYPPRWQAQAAAFRAAMGARARLGLAYGPGPRQRYDLFLPDAAPRGVFVFIHGGYWMAFGPADFSHLAAGAVARGWAAVLPSYPLAPEARIGQMVQDMAQMQACVARPGLPLVVAGHSAGGHLAARLACSDLACSDLAGPRPDRVVPISPLADLDPLRATAMNATLRLTAAEALAESPAHLAPAPGVAVHVRVGGQERPAFLWQARLLAEAWGCPWSVDPGRHHFDVIDPLADPGSDLCGICLDGL